jgi:hypothetical protein
VRAARVAPNGLRGIGQRLFRETGAISEVVPVPVIP